MSHIDIQPDDATKSVGRPPAPSTKASRDPTLLGWSLRALVCVVLLLAGLALGRSIGKALYHLLN